jgi:hypothetical protein
VNALDIVGPSACPTLHPSPPSPLTCSLALATPQEPLLSTLLQHKWEVFARAQFLLHFAGYLLLEVSQTILIWLISDPVEWNRWGWVRAC